MTTSLRSDTRQRALSWAALSVVYVVWGTTYLAIRVGVRDVPPLLFAGIRYVVAGVLLYPLAVRSSARQQNSVRATTRPNAAAWLAGGFVGVVLLFLGNGGLTVGLTTLPSGFAAVLVATVPLWMILFARLLRGQAITWRKIVALLVGLSGVAVLTKSAGGSGHTLGIIIVLAASAAWAFGSVIGHRLKVSTNVLFAASIEMLVGGGVLLLVAGASGEFSRVHWSSLPTSTWISLVYLIGPGSMLAFSAYQYALSHLSTSTVSTYAFVNPIVAVLAGSLFLGEQLTAHEVLGAALVVGSVIIIQLRTPEKRRHADKVTFSPTSPTQRDPILSK